MLKDAHESSDGAPAWDTGTHEDFYKYYEQQSLAPQTIERFRTGCATLLRIHGPAAAGKKLDILDIGCGAGTQCLFWAEAGHCYWGIDINEPLVRLAKLRATEQGLNARFDVGTATALPCGDATIDICLLPELLEHVADWQACISEAIRVLRPNGLIYINTSNQLCPRQQEFNLPLYSWYPHRLKRYFEHRALTDRPDLANYAKYPAVNWFSYYKLRDYLGARGFDCLDRFDLVAPSGKSTVTRMVLRVLKLLPFLRLLGQVATPYTLVVGRKRPIPHGE